MRIHIQIPVLIAILVTSCKNEPKETGWKYANSIALDGINPIGIASAGNGDFWLSDGDHFRVVKVDDQGTVLTTVDSLDRPMHIASYEGQLVIPQYGNDEVIRFRESTQNTPEERIIVSLKDSLDAPAGADIKGNEIAIADFYNNKIHYAGPDDKWIVFGQEGKEDGDFYYPTDVQIVEDAIWVADAYNNRLQKFSKTGTHLLTVGEAQDMNASTGIYVSKDQVISTDFENNRVLVWDAAGVFKQELKEEITKPTDVLIQDDKLYVANYKTSTISVYEWGEIAPVQNHNDDHHDHHDEHDDHHEDGDHEDHE